MREGKVHPNLFSIELLLTTTRKQAVMLVFGVLNVLWQPPAPKTNGRVCFRGFYLSLATTSPENKHDCSSSGFGPFSGIHHSRKGAQLLVFGGLDLSLAATSPENEHICSFRGFDCSLTATTPENEPGVLIVLFYLI
jgi:hypothetical protein